MEPVTGDDAADADVTPDDPGSSGDSGLRTLAVATGIGILGIVLLNLVGLAAILTGEGVGFELVGEEGLDILPSTLINGVGQVIGFGGLTAAYLWYRGYDFHSGASYLGLRWPSLRELGVALGGLLGMIVLLAVVSVVVSLFSSPAENVAAQGAAEEPDVIPAMIAVMILIVGPFEELLYRGIVQSRLRERFSMVPAILAASVVFASVHAAGALAGSPTEILTTVFVLFVISLVLGYLYEYTGNIVVPALVHGAFNSFQLTGIYLTETSDAIEAVLVAGLV